MNFCKHWAKLSNGRIYQQSSGWSHASHTERAQFVYLFKHRNKDKPSKVPWRSHCRSESHTEHNHCPGLWVVFPLLVPAVENISCSLHRAWNPPRTAGIKPCRGRDQWIQQMLLKIHQHWTSHLQPGYISQCTPPRFGSYPKVWIFSWMLSLLSSLQAPFPCSFCSSRCDACCLTPSLGHKLCCEHEQRADGTL